MKAATPAGPADPPVASPTTAGTPVFIPFDMNPVATNNLARYILHPLITLPPNATIQVIIQNSA